MKNTPLPDLTLGKLGLSQPPLRWPETGQYRFHIGTASMPWAGHSGRPWAAAQAAQHAFLRDFLAQYGIAGWVRATGTAAVVRRQRGDVLGFDVIVNGVKLWVFDGFLASRYALRLQRRGIDAAITACGICIEGGGALPGGELRDYVLLLDQPAMRDRAR